MDTDLETMAMTATWFWNTQSAKHFYIGADNKPHWQLLSNTIQQEANGLHLASPAIQSDQPIFQNVSSGVATDISSYNKRWTSFQTISRSVLEGGNPYENIRAVLDHLGFVAKKLSGKKISNVINLKT